MLSPEQIQIPKLELFNQQIQAPIVRKVNLTNSKSRAFQEKYIAQLPPVGVLKPDEAGTFNGLVGKEGTAVITSVDSSGRKLILGGNKNGSTTFGIGAEITNSSTNPAYIVNQKLGENVDAYVFGNAKDQNTIGINLSIPGKDASGNIFVENGNGQTYIRGVVGKRF